MNSRRALVLGIIVLAVISAAVLVVRTPRTSGQPSGERVMVVRLYGTIQETGGGVFGATGVITPAAVKRQLDLAERSPAIRAVVLRVSSPGGSIAASQAIYDMIKRFEKPIVVSMGDTAASGGYYIAAAADGIVAHPGTITGSIGVITAMTKLDELYEKLGIEVEIIKSGRHKDMFQRPLTEEERALLQSLNDEAWRQFIEAVAEGRGLEPDFVRELATGEVFIGTRAYELGLVDRLGDLDDAVAFAGELAGLTDPVPYEPPGPTPWQQFFGLIGEMRSLLQSRALFPADWLYSFEGVPRMRYQWL